MLMLSPAELRTGLLLNLSSELEFTWQRCRDMGTGTKCRKAQRLSDDYRTSIIIASLYSPLLPVSELPSVKPFSRGASLKMKLCKSTRALCFVIRTQSASWRRAAQKI